MEKWVQGSCPFDSIFPPSSSFVNGGSWTFALAATSHGYILGTHMNEHTLVNNVMWVMFVSIKNWAGSLCLVMFMCVDPRITICEYAKKTRTYSLCLSNVYVCWFLHDMRFLTLGNPSGTFIPSSQPASNHILVGLPRAECGAPNHVFSFYTTSCTYRWRACPSTSMCYFESTQRAFHP